MLYASGSANLNPSRPNWQPPAHSVLSQSSVTPFDTMLLFGKLKQKHKKCFLFSVGFSRCHLLDSGFLSLHQVDEMNLGRFWFRYKYRSTRLVIFERDTSFLYPAERAGINPTGPAGFSLNHCAGYLLPSASVKVKQEISHARPG